MKLVRLVIVMLACAIPHTTFATSKAPEATVALEVVRHDGISVSNFKARADGVPYRVGAHITVPGGFLTTGDLYVGVIRPGGKEVFTWVDDNGTARLQRGFKPLLTDLELRTGRLVSVDEQHGKVIEHAFTQDQPRGMYIVFAVIVVGEQDPADVVGWYGVEMEPLFVE